MSGSGRGAWFGRAGVARLLGLVVVGLLTGAALCSGGESARLPVEVTAEWQFTRIWKDAKRSKENFYEGQLGLRNNGKAAVENATAIATLYGPDGVKIDESAPVQVGALQPGKSVVKEFIINKGLQFAEVRVTVSGTVGGAKGEAEFSTSDGTRPNNLADSPNGLAVVSREIDKSKGTSSKKGGSLFFNCRIKNVNPYPVQDLKAKFTFVAGKTNKAVEAAVDAKVLKAGETKAYSGIKVADVPAGYPAYSIEITGTQAAEAAGGAERTGTAAVSGEPLQIGPIEIVKERKLVVFTITSRDEGVMGGRMVAQLQLKNAAGSVIKMVQRTLPQAFPKGKAVTVEISIAGLPDFDSCEVGAGFAPDEKSESK